MCYGMNCIYEDSYGECTVNKPPSDAACCNDEYEYEDSEDIE